MPSRTAERERKPDFKDRLAPLFLRPWMDRVMLYGVTRWYLPLSRIWATGLERRGVEGLLDELPSLEKSAKKIGPVLERLLDREADYLAAHNAWLAKLFDEAPHSQGELTRAERRRVATAHAFMAMRSGFAGMRGIAQVPPARWAIPGPAEVEARHGARLKAAQPFPPPPTPVFAQSAALERSTHSLSWLRWPSMVGGQPDTAWARVLTPHNVINPPTLIFLHGIAMEGEFWAVDRDPVQQLVRSGVRVISPEGPWHGRRRKSGYYGGEPTIAHGPMGLLDLFQAWVGEIASLTAWARSNGDGRVALGGVSLGALTSQMAASASPTWPAEMRPDGLFLVVTSGAVVESTVAGSLVRGVGLPAALAAAGWDEASLHRLAPLAEPSPTPPLAPENLVMLLGLKDDVLPYPGGVALARAWGVAPENLFQRQQGHFTAYVGLSTDPSPLQRVAALLKR